MAHDSKPSELANRVIILLLSVICLIHLAGFATTFLCNNDTFSLVEDDSLITFRVANNIAHGMGPYFNAGEHVAANTSLFWPFVLSPAFHYRDLSHAVVLLSIISVALTSAILALVALGATSTIAAALTAATLLFLPSLVMYAPTAWEHIPQTVLSTLAMLLLLGRPKWLGRYHIELCMICLGLAFLLRPDTLPLMLVPGVVLLFRLVRRFELSSLLALVFAAVCIAGYFLLHRHLYGGYLPNTYYLKVAFGLSSIQAGITYTAVTALRSAGPLFVLALLMFWLAERKQPMAGEQLVLLSMILQCSYVVAVGGDVFPGGRFYLLILPTAVLLFWEKAEEQFFRTSVRTPAATLAVILDFSPVLSMRS